MSWVGMIQLAAWLGVKAVAPTTTQEEPPTDSGTTSIRDSTAPQIEPWANEQNIIVFDRLTGTIHELLPGDRLPPMSFVRQQQYRLQRRGFTTQALFSLIGFLIIQLLSVIRRFRRGPAA